MGQQIVQDLAHCATTALNAAIPALVDSLNPMKKLKAAGDVVGSFVHPLKQSGDGNSGSSGSEAPPPQPPPRPSAAPPNATDPALPEVLKVITYLAAVNTILRGKDDDVDWDKAKGDGTHEGAVSSVKFLKGMLDDHLQQFQTLATSAEPSVTLTKVLEVSSKVRIRALHLWSISHLNAHRSPPSLPTMLPSQHSQTSTSLRSRQQLFRSGTRTSMHNIRRPIHWLLQPDRSLAMRLEV